MKRVSQTKPFDFGIILGDNHYTYGVENGIEDQKWRTNFEDIYADRLHIPFFAIIGNHDTFLFPDSQIEYAGSMSTSWNMPDYHYSFRVGDVLFVALNSCNMLSPDQYNGNPYMGREQFVWLEKVLKTSPAKRKIVFMHHLFFSNGPHYVDSWSRRGVTREEILSLFNATSVDLVLSGHEHSSPLFDGAVHGLRPKFLITGNASEQDTRRPHQDLSTVFDLEAHRKSHSGTGGLGFVVLDVHGSAINISFYDEKSAAPLYSYDLPAP